MRACITAVALVVTLAASAAHAATIVEFSGNTHGSLATGQLAVTLDSSLTFFTGDITNTAPHDARITAFGFDLGAGNLSGYSGTTLVAPAGTDFTFSDGNLGNVPQFNSAELDFGYLTGSNFSGGSPNDGLDNFQTFSFRINGDFAGFSEAEIAAALFARFQRVGADGRLSDVSRPGDDVPVIPEPGSMLLLGTGLAYLARKRYQRALDQ